jgi:hypothetical protein
VKQFPTVSLFILALSLDPQVLLSKVDFNREVLPILSDNCFKCHGPDEATREADLRLDTEAGAFADLGGGYFPIVAGDPAKSEMIYHIYAEDEEDQMPPPDSELSLSASEKDLIRQWIAEGAEWKKHWSFEPVERPDLAAVTQDEWPRNGIDNFVLARLEKEGFKPSEEADRTTLIRRVTLDLTGLPPTPQEVDAFLSDTEPGAYERVVDRLLASPRYGEAMALPWLDAARYADTDGYQNDGPRDMWRWRDWVIDAYNQNKPFDEFTIEQLAGDLLTHPTLDQIIATGFNRNHRYNSESGLVFEEFLLENAVDRVDTTSTVWMGVTMGCARCHDHKYDPFSTKEYYQLISYFNSIPESGRARKYGNSEPWVLSPTKEQSQELARKEADIEKLISLLSGQEASVANAQTEWERSGGNLSERELLKQRLRFDYSFDGSDKGLAVETGQPWLSSGVLGTAATLDGQSEFVVESAPILASEHRFSISFWIKPDEVEDAVVLSRQQGGTTRPGMTVELKEGRLQFYIITRWIAGVGAIETTQTLDPGEWRHVTLTNDSSMSATGMEIYLDGELADTQILYNSNSNPGVTAKGAEMKIGGGVVGNRFKGRLDELRIYDRTLRVDEVALLAEQTRLQDIVSTPFAARSESERGKLRAYFLENAAPDSFSELAASLHAARMDRTAFVDSIPTTMIMQEMETPKPTFVRTRGIYDSYGEKVDRVLPEILPPPDEELPSNRLGFAKWLVSGKHPLTGRVAVNRYWLKYFGRGLVKTAEDFGLQGDWPSHPELLDWLADEFVRLNWDVKAMQKLIVTSATYRQSSKVTAEMLERDPENIIFTRGPRQRLSAHVVRDQALAVSGLLVEQLGGPSVSPYQPKNFWEDLSNMKYEQSQGEDLYRRSLYTIWKRTLPPPSMAVLDAADRESCMVSTKRTNTPLQALTMLNEKAFVEAARNFGQRILLEGGERVEDKVEFAFKTIAARLPNPQEFELLKSAFNEYMNLYSDDSDSAEALIHVGESKPLRALSSTELAAATTFANMLLNLDEVVTKE